MAEQIVTCPKCGNAIPLNEAFSQELEKRFHRELESELKKKDLELQRAIESKQKEFREAYNRELARAEEQARSKARESLATELSDLKTQLQEKSTQLDSARKQELEFRKKQRELEERERTLELDLNRQLDLERTKIWEQASARAAEEHRFRESEKDKQLADMRKQIEELKQKAELTSQQSQGEVLELELEHILVQYFRTDRIEPVAKGVRGADIIQRVQDETGHFCGSIVWESKRTKAWSDGWLQKLKDDRQNAKAEIAVIVSISLPKDITHFGLCDGVWITDFASVVGLATVLRFSLIQLAYANKALTGKSEKMEMIYTYLTGAVFKQRVEGIVESFIAMKDDLESEKRAMMKLWKKREGQIDRVIQNTSEMHGELEGIIGSALPSMKVLELPSGNGNDEEVSLEGR